MTAPAPESEDVRRALVGWPRCIEPTGAMGDERCGEWIDKLEGPMVTAGGMLAWRVCRRGHDALMRTDGLPDELLETMK